MGPPAANQLIASPEPRGFSATKSTVTWGSDSSEGRGSAVWARGSCCSPLRAGQRIGNIPSPGRIMCTLSKSQQSCFWYDIVRIYRRISARQLSWLWDILFYTCLPRLVPFNVSLADVDIGCFDRDKSQQWRQGSDRRLYPMICLVLPSPQDVLEIRKDPTHVL